ASCSVVLSSGLAYLTLSSLSPRVSTYSSLFFFFLLRPPPPSSTLFPYTTLFRSDRWLPWSGGRQSRPPSGYPLRQCAPRDLIPRSEEHTSELQSRVDLVCRLLLEKKNA